MPFGTAILKLKNFKKTDFTIQKIAAVAQDILKYRQKVRFWAVKCYLFRKREWNPLTADSACFSQNNPFEPYYKRLV
jgi:hypothetical protein